MKMTIHNYMRVLSYVHQPLCANAVSFKLLNFIKELVWVDNTARTNN